MKSKKDKMMMKRRQMRKKKMMKDSDMGMKGTGKEMMVRGY